MPIKDKITFSIQSGYGFSPSRMLSFDGRFQCAQLAEKEEHLSGMCYLDHDVTSILAQ